MPLRVGTDASFHWNGFIGFWHHDAVFLMPCSILSLGRRCIAFLSVCLSVCLLVCLFVCYLMDRFLTQKGNKLQHVYFGWCTERIFKQDLCKLLNLYGPIPIICLVAIWKGVYICWGNVVYFYYFSLLEATFNCLFHIGIKCLKCGCKENTTWELPSIRQKPITR